jgi:hypothetical protein
LFEKKQLTKIGDQKQLAKYYNKKVGLKREGVDGAEL